MIAEYLKNINDFDKIYNKFSWKIPKNYNIAHEICDRHSFDTQKIAMYFEDEKGKEKQFTFHQFKEYSNRLAHVFQKLTIRKGDRIAVFLPQGPEAALCHLAIFKLGAISVPLSTMFGPESVAHRLGDCGARIIITDDENKRKLNRVKDELDSLENILVVGETENDEIDFYKKMRNSSPDFQIKNTSSDDPAILVYTSGTTGLPKGALHAHRCIPGRLTGFQLAHNFFPQPGDMYWSPAEWAWIGGLLDSLFTPWLFGIPVLVLQRKKFDPERTFHLLGKYGARNAFIPPTALKMMRNVPNPRNRYKLKMRSLHSGGESLPSEILKWGQEVFGSLAEMYGMTEVGFVVGNSPSLLKVKPGSMGKAYPGHIVEIIGEEDKPVPPNTLGQIGIHRADPGMFLGYWNNLEGTKEKFAGDWFLSNDMAHKDEEGYFWFKTRTDDVIISAGYRIGPTEIEKCIFQNPCVEDVAVIGAPNPIRGQIVKAFIQLKKGEEPSVKLRKDIQELVKTKLSMHEYPREIEFVEKLPRTTTGKIKRSALREQEHVKAKVTEGADA